MKLKKVNIVHDIVNDMCYHFIMLEQEKKINELINNIGSFIEYWGFRKIHGRIWAKVFISEKPLSTPEIVKSLNVSKALISGAINELLEHKLIIKVGQVKFGGITYSACPNPAEVVRDVIKNRELVLFENIERNLQDINQLGTQDCKSLGVDKESIKTLKVLTGHHKKIAQKLCKKNIKTLDEWVSFIKKVSRFAF